MTFTKKKLAQVVSGSLLTAAVATPALAVINLDLVNDTIANNEQVITYASELNVVAGTTGLALADGAGGTAGTTQDIQGDINANATPANTDIRIKVTLSSGTFINAPSMATIGGQAFSILTGGAGQSTVTFDGNSGAGGFAANQNFDINIDGVRLTAAAPVTVNVEITLADNFGVTPLPGFTNAPFITFADSYGVSADTTNADTDRIDVVQNSLFFSSATGDVNKNVGGIRVTFTAGRLDTTSAAIAPTNIAPNIVKSVDAANGLAAFNQGTVGGSVLIGAAATTISTANTTAVTGTLVTPTATDATGSQDVVLSVPAANTVVIAETGLTGSVAATAASTNVNTTSLNKTVTLGSLQRNGSSARLTFALTPGGKYKYFVRLTNPAAISGAVTISLTNDDGVTSTPIGIGSIANVASDNLAAGASTGLIPIQALYDAVVAANPTFALSTTEGLNKLRVNANAAFGADGANSGLVMGAFSLSEDGGTFNMVTNAGNRVN